jgi:hypothetical protein
MIRFADPVDPAFHPARVITRSIPGRGGPTFHSETLLLADASGALICHATEARVREAKRRNKSRGSKGCSEEEMGREG